MTFEEVYNKVEESSHEVAFNKGEAQKLYELLMELPKRSNVVEIGIQYGRSTTVFAEVSKLRSHHFTAIDPWVEDVSEEAKGHVYSQMSKYDWKFDLISKKSHDAFKKYHKKIDLIHIDGDHTYEGVMTDMKDWCPKVKSGGYILFDDYGHDSLPEVFKAVSEYMIPDYYDYVGRYGDKLGVFKKK